MRGLATTLVIISAVAVSAAACVEELPPASIVDKLRVLGIRAEPPEVRPGESVALSALVFDPEGREITLSWSACVIADRGQGLFAGSTETSTSGAKGAALEDPGSCLGQLELGDPYAQELGNAPTAALMVPPDLFDTQVPLKRVYGLPDIEIPSSIEEVFYGIAGVNMTVTLVATAGDDRIEATKRVNVSIPTSDTTNPPNQNPTNLAFHLSKKSDNIVGPPTAVAPLDRRCLLGEDQNITLERDTKYVVQPVNIPDPQAEYTVLLTGTSTDEPFETKTVEETYFFSYFSTVGRLGDEVTKSKGDPDTSWTIPEDASGPADFWVVVRDGRGGLTWCHSQLEVAP